MEDWRGSLCLKDGNEIHDIRLSTTTSDPIPKCSLQFLSYVDVSQIPLHLICGPRSEVWTTNPETGSWFSSHLFGPTQEREQNEWWHNARLESPLGILAAVQAEDGRSQPRVTEVLFYTARKDGPVRPPTPPHSSQQDTPDIEYQLYAVPLSSDLLPSNVATITPPASPSLNPLHAELLEGRFLPRPWESHTSTFQKRKQALETTFTAADEARKRAKRHLGESVAAAAAGNNTQPFLPTLKSQKRNTDRRPSLDARSQIPLFTRPATRSPSVSSLRREPTEHKRSSLARVTPAPAPAPAPEDTKTVQKNKDTISKVVMAGMRVWGLSQSKRSKRKSKGDPQLPPSDEPDETEKHNDDEYKLIYHHVYKAAVFAFRNSVSDVDLGVATHAEAVRDTVDTLLEVFCSEPLGRGFGGEERVMSAGPKGTIVRTPIGEEDKRLG